MGRASGDFEDDCREAHRILKEVGGNSTEAARRLGIPRSTLQTRVAAYHRKNLGGDAPVEVPPGAEIASSTIRTNASGEVTGRTDHLRPEAEEDAFEPPEGHEVAGVSAFTDADGRVHRRWIKTRRSGGRSPGEIEEAARIAAETHTRPPPERVFPVAKEDLDPDLLNLHLLPDLHLGSESRRSASARDWNLDTAVSLYRSVVLALLRRAPPAKTGVILVGGDALDYDDDTKTTRKSGARMDGATPYPELLAAAENLFAYHAEAALHVYDDVIVRVLPGNHDPDSAIAITHYLRAHFRHEPRVVVDSSGDLFWHYQHGRVMLSATHGHTVKPSALPGIMATDEPRAWGESLWRYAHSFHLHHAAKGRLMDHEAGATWEVHEAPVSPNTWAWTSGYRAHRSLKLITYSADRGETGRTTESLG